MTNRTAITVVVAMLVNAVLFGVGAVTVLSVPALDAHAQTLLPLVVGLSFILAVPIAWKIAPQLRARAAASRIVHARTKG